MALQTYWAMNEVARDLEDPFVYEPNDLPLARFQVRPLVHHMGLYPEPGFGQPAGSHPAAP